MRSTHLTDSARAAGSLPLITPSDRLGLRQSGGLKLADDPRIYTYRQTRYTSSLFLVSGVR